MSTKYVPVTVDYKSAWRIIDKEVERMAEEGMLMVFSVQVAVEAVNAALGIHDDFSCPVCRGVGERSDLSAEVGHSVPCSECDGTGYKQEHRPCTHADDEPHRVWNGRTFEPCDRWRRYVAMLGGDPTL